MIAFEGLPQIGNLGLEGQRPQIINFQQDLKWNKKLNKGSGGYTHGKIDWDEFWRVVKGNGPMNNERISTKRKAWHEGLWVRNAARAYALKKQSTVVAAE